MKLLVKNIVKETADAVSINFKNNSLFKKVKYKPGQFITLHFVIDETVHKRAYSFSSNPYTDKDLKVTVKRVDNGLVSNYVHDNLKVGDKISFDNPTGSFYVEPKKNINKQYVLFSGGSGITPMFSIIKSVLTQNSDANILLIYANNNTESIIFKDELDALEKEYPNNFRVEHIISSEEVAKPNYHKGLVTESLMNTIFEKHSIDYKEHKYMICGPLGYMDKIKEVLVKNNVQEENIKIEVFKAAKVAVADTNATSKVTIKHKGEEHVLELKRNQPILQQAIAQKVNLPYSCRSGMCSTCKGTCTSGKINMTEGHFLNQNDVDSGVVLTCISYPETDDVTIEI